MVIWWYMVIWYVLRSPLRPLARPCIFDGSISCSQNPISPEDVIERTGFFYKSPHSFSPALLETAKVLVFLLSLVFHVFGVLISLWLHTNAAGLPKGWKTAHIFAANLCYIHSWLLIGSICTSNDRVCKVPLRIKLVPAHHLVGGWQGHVRRCLQTIHAINLFPPKWLPINCFTLTKDGLQTLNIPCLRAKSGSNCLDLLHWSYLKVSLSCGNSMSLSWILEMPLAPFLCHLPLVPCYSVKKSLTYSFSPALLETAKVLVFFLSLVFHVFGVLILLWLHTNAAGLPKGWKTAHIFAHKDRIQPHISPLAEQTDRGSSLIKYQ